LYALIDGERKKKPGDRRHVLAFWANQSLLLETRKLACILMALAPSNAAAERFFSYASQRSR
jgi:hypothetical protein